MLRVRGARLDGVLALRDADDAWKLNDQLAGGGPLVVVGRLYRAGACVGR